MLHLVMHFSSYSLLSSVFVETDTHNIILSGHIYFMWKRKAQTLLFKKESRYLTYDQVVKNKDRYMQF